MAWIRGDTVFEIIQGFSLENTKRKLKDHLNRGWHQHGEIREHGNGYACLIYKEVNKRGKEQVFREENESRKVGV